MQAFTETHCSCYSAHEMTELHQDLSCCSVEWGLCLSHSLILLLLKSPAVTQNLLDVCDSNVFQEVLIFGAYPAYLDFIKHNITKTHSVFKMYFLKIGSV